MKVVCVGYLQGAGGAERQIVLLANELAEFGHDVYFIVMAENNLKYELSSAVKMIDLAYLEEKKGNTLLKRYFALKEELKKIMPDISINFWFQSAYFMSAMSKKITGKIIYAERGDPGDKEYEGMLGIIRKLSFKRIDGFVFQSEGARDYFDKCIVNKSVIIHNAISVPEKEYLYPCTNRRKVIINVGRLHEQKNQILLIDVFALIAEKIPEYTLEIYGDGELKETLHNRIVKLGLEKRVKLLPSRKDIFSCIYNASVFVLSSNYEGMPNVLMEAMALGVPSISTDCKPGGARALIEDGKNGYIVPINDKEALKEAILKVLSLSDEQRGELCEQSQMIRGLHRKEEIYKRWNQYIESLVT